MAPPNSGDEDFDSWAAAMPSYWFCFPVDALSSFQFDPEDETDHGATEEKMDTIGVDKLTNELTILKAKASCRRPQKPKKKNK